MVPTYSAITRQSIEVESCSNPVKVLKDLYFLLKKLGSFGFESFVGDVINKGWFRPFWSTSSGPGSQPQEEILCFFSLKETRQKIPIFRALLIGLLAFVVQKLWPEKTN